MVGSSSLSKARNRLPVALFTKLADHVAHLAAAISQPWAVWRGHRVVDFDGTCLSMEDNPELMAEFGTCNTKHGPGRYPLARVVVAMLWGTMTVLGYAVGAYAVSEQALAAEILPMLSSGDLAVGDRHFAGVNYCAKYIERGIEFLTRVHQRLKIGRLRRLVTYSPRDFVVEMRVGKQHRREDPSLPKSVTVRLIRVEGRPLGEFVFLGPLGGRLTESHTLKCLKEDREKLEIAQRVLHSFRHFFVSMCAQSSVPIFTCMSWVGHKDSDMVWYYYHLHDKASKDAMERLAASRGVTPDGKVEVLAGLVPGERIAK